MTLPDPTAIELVVFDMAGTTVRDDGVVERAFALAADRTGVADAMGREAALSWVRETMGMSKIEVFTHIAGGEVAAAERATAAFEHAYAELARDEGVAEVPGAGALLADLREAGLRIALTTGFAPVTRDAILDGLGWHDLVDVALSPVDAGRGRPAPDLALTALIRTGASATAAMVTAGDTASDVQCGLRAGAAAAFGVLSGAHDRETLAAAGATAVLDDVTALRGILLEGR